MLLTHIIIISLEVKFEGAQPNHFHHEEHDIQDACCVKGKLFDFATQIEYLHHQTNSCLGGYFNCYGDKVKLFSH
jgi:hypothetical protein